MIKKYKALDWLHNLYDLNIRLIYGKPDVPAASHEVTSEVYAELEELQRNEDWDVAVQLVVKAGDPKAQYLAHNDWYRLRRSLEIIKVSSIP